MPAPCNDGERSAGEEECGEKKGYLRNAHLAHLLRCARRPHCRSHPNPSGGLAPPTWHYTTPRRPCQATPGTVVGVRRLTRDLAEWHRQLGARDRRGIRLHSVGADRTVAIRPTAPQHGQGDGYEANAGHTHLRQRRSTLTPHVAPPLFSHSASRSPYPLGYAPSDTIPSQNEGVRFPSCAKLGVCS